MQQRAFTLIEFLIALVIIGFIVSILIGVFASPIKQASIDAKVAQVKDGLRQLAEAAELNYARNGDPSASPATLIANGLISSAPAVPSGIDGTGTAFYGNRARRIGGCGPSNVGASVQDHPALRDVSLAFCQNYNKAQGLGSIVVPNCADASAPCAASGDVNTTAPSDPGTVTFCWDYNSTAYWIFYRNSVEYMQC